MDSFKDREKGFENKFAHDQELQFRAVARRNRLIGHWAAELMGKSEEEAKAYAIEVVKTDFGKPGHEDVVLKLARDLGDRSDESVIRIKMEEFLAVAKTQLMSETQ